MDSPPQATVRDHLLPALVPAQAVATAAQVAVVTVDIAGNDTVEEAPSLNPCTIMEKEFTLALSQVTIRQSSLLS